MHLCVDMDPQRGAPEAWGATGAQWAGGLRVSQEFRVKKTHTYLYLVPGIPSLKGGGGQGQRGNEGARGGRGRGGGGGCVDKGTRSKLQVSCVSWKG